MEAFGHYLVLKDLDEDVKQTDGGIFIANKAKPNIGHYEVLSVDSSSVSNIKVGDTVWVLTAVVSKSSNLGQSICITKVENIMAKD